MSLSTTLNQAAKLQERINGLRKQLSGLLNKARQEHASAPAPEIPADLRRAGKAKGRDAKVSAAKAGRAAAKPVTGKGRRAVKNDVVKVSSARKGRATATTNGRGRGSLAGRARAASPSGPLAPAVVQVLQANGKPMRVADILEGLFKNGYTFSSAEPKKNLAARIYRLNGVKQVAEGLFAQV